MILEHGANLIYLYFYTLSKIRGQMCISANIRLEAKHPRVRKEGLIKIVEAPEASTLDIPSQSIYLIWSFVLLKYWY